MSGRGPDTTASEVAGDPDPFVLLSLVPPAILDHVIVEMSVRVNGRSIVRANFTVYNCSRVGQVYPRTA